MYMLILAVILVTGDMTILTKMVSKQQDCVETAKQAIPELENSPQVVAYTFACPKVELA